MDIIKSMVYATAASMLLFSCSPEEDVKEEAEAVVVDPSSLTLNSNGDPATFTVIANYDWEITTKNDWIRLEPTSGAGDKTAHTITVSADEYLDEDVDRTTEITVTLPQGKTATVTLTQMKYIPVSDEPEVIKTAGDFINYMANYASEATSSTVKTIAADIDMAGKTYTAPSSFKGTLDGQGHVIRNMKFARPIVDTLSGIIKNIKLDASCTYEYNHAIQTVVPFAGWLIGGTLSGCENNVNIRVTNPEFIANDVAQNMYFSAFAGKMEKVEGGNAPLIENCINNGTITVELSGDFAQAAEYHVAGFVAIGNAGEVKDCTNNGALSILDNTAAGMNPKKEAMVGGFVSKNKYTIFEDCRNNGDIRNEKNVGKTRASGAIGYQDKVDDGKNYDILVGGEVKCKVVIGYYESPANLPNRNEVAASAGMVVGRMAGQSGKSSNLYFGTETNPVKIAGSIECIESGHELAVTLSADNYTKYVCGGGSATNYSPAADLIPVTWQVWRAGFLSK